LLDIGDFILCNFKEYPMAFLQVYFNGELKFIAIDLSQDAAGAANP